MQVILGARHRHIEKPAFFLDFCRYPGTEVGRNAAVDDVEHEDRFPFLALGGMNGGEDQVILVEQWHAPPARRRSAQAGSGRHGASQHLREFD